MSWKPPPSFGAADGPASPKAKRGSTGAGANMSPMRDVKGKRTTWAPPSFVVRDETGDLPLANLNADSANHAASSRRQSKPPAQAEISPVRNKKAVSPTISPTGGSRPKAPKNVGWNQTLFVVDQVGGGAPAGDDNLADSIDDDQDAADNEIQIPSRADLGFDKGFISKKELLVVDQTMLRTRLQWSQQLVRKAFKPYRQMICAVDDNLPNPEEMIDMDNENEDEDYLEGKKELTKIRDEMLDDPVLNEKEIAAFFEGYKLFQMKVNSLQSQLDSMKAMQKMSLQSSFVGARGLKGERHLSPLSMSVFPIRNTSIPFRGNFNNLSKSLAPTQLVDVNEQGPPSTALKPPARSDKTSDDAGDPGASQPGVSKRESRSSATSRTKVAPSLSRSLRQMSIQRVRESTREKGGNSVDIQKLLQELEEAERRQRKLEKQLAQAGVVIAEDIPYELAKEKVENIARRMGEIGGSDVDNKDLQEEYFLLEREMEKYTAALMLSDEWIAEQEEMERQWEEAVTPVNVEALKKLRRHMAVDVRNRSEATLASEPTPNGKYLPQNIAKKFKRTNVLQLLRIDPEDIVPMHAATLENMRVTGLTLTERRAMYHHLRDVGPRWQAMQGDKMTERKWTWFNMMKSNFKENVDSWQRHVDQYGPPGNHPYATHDNPGEGCPLLGKQCPLRADKTIDYDGDYGYPEGPVYFKSDVKKSEVDNVSKAKQEAQDALKQKKSEERSILLKEHYKGKILQVSLANGSCEAMDEAMDSMENSQEKWIKARLSNQDGLTDEVRKKEVTAFHDALNELKLSILQFAERSGMQLTGKRDANADQPDIRSMVEVALCEEVIETAFDFFKGIQERMAEIKVRDGRMKVTIEQLRNLLDELQERNRSTIESLGQQRPPRSRELKSSKEIEISVRKAFEREQKSKESKNDAPPGGPPSGLPGRGGGRGDLLSALKGRGGGGAGRGDQLSALQGRGGDGGGFLAAIASRGGGE